MAFTWSEVLASRGVDVADIKAHVEAKEKTLQAEQKAFHEERNIAHDPALHGLALAQVRQIVKGHLSAAQYEVCGEEYVQEVWDAL